jgi:hypothetical protein
MLFYSALQSILSTNQAQTLSPILIILENIFELKVSARLLPSSRCVLFPDWASIEILSWDVD